MQKNERQDNATFFLVILVGYINNITVKQQDTKQGHTKNSKKEEEEGNISEW